MPVRTDINAMIRTKQIVKRVLMSTREKSDIIRADLHDGNVPCPAIASSIACPN
jgi:hypothetical protein